MHQRTHTISFFRSGSNPEIIPLPQSEGVEFRIQNRTLTLSHYTVICTIIILSSPLVRAFPWIRVIGITVFLVVFAFISRSSLLEISSERPAHQNLSCKSLRFTQ